MAPSVSAAPVPLSGAGASSGVSPVTGGPERLPLGTRAVGPLSGASRLSVDVALRPADPAALTAFAQAVTTPGSAEFRHFIGPGEFAARFGPDPTAAAATRAWLESKGLAVGTTTRDGLLIPVSGPASALGAAFGVGFDQELLPGGRMVREPTGPPSVPSPLAATVQGVVGLADLAQPTAQLARPAPGVASPRPPASGSLPRTGPSACGAAQAAGTTATELAQAYSMASLYPADEGQSVTVGIYELEPYSPADISSFDACYGISTTVTPVPVDIPVGDATDGAGSGESALDIEMVAGLAPEASIRVYVGPNFGVGPLDVYRADGRRRQRPGSVHELGAVRTGERPGRDRGGVEPAGAGGRAGPDLHRRRR